MEKSEEKEQNIPKKEEILAKLKKINPYRPLLRNPEDGKVLDTQSFVYYQKFVQWLVDILLNGFFLWIILISIFKLQYHWLCILPCGILVWFVLEALEKIVRIIKR